MFFIMIGLNQDLSTPTFLLKINAIFKKIHKIQGINKQ